MPTYRMHLTTFAACLLSIGSVSAQGGEPSFPRNDNSGVPGVAQDRLIMVEESVGLVTPLRQTHRLEITRPKVPSFDEVLSGLPVSGPVVAASPDPVVPLQTAGAVVSERAGIMRAAIDAPDAPEQAPVPSARRGDLGGADVVIPARASLPPAGQVPMLLSSQVPAGAPAVEPAVVHENPLGAMHSVSLVEVPAGGSARDDKLPPAQVASEAPRPNAAELDASVPVVTLPTGSDLGAVAALDLVEQNVSPALPTSAATSAPLVQLASASVVSDVGTSPLVSTLVVGGATEQAPSSNVPKSWVLSRDDRTIKAALERWTQLTEWQLAWEYPTDFQISFNAQFDGDFVEVVTKVVEGLSGPERPIRAEFYNGNRVLRIVSGRE